MINAKYELLVKLENYNYKPGDIKCFKIILDEWEAGEINLHKDEYVFTSKSEGDLFHFLDFNYDSGYGTQLIEAVILMKDGSWFERNEYDGSEWWEFKKPLTCEDILK